MSLTRAGMTASAGLLGLAGLGCLFLPETVAVALGLPAEAGPALPLAASGLLGVAAVDWTGRGAIYGGVYGKPIVAGNFVLGALTTLGLLPLQVADPTPLGVPATVAFALHWALFTRWLYWPPFAEQRRPAPAAERGDAPGRSDGRGGPEA